MNGTDDILGVTNFGPVSGSPLIPPEAVTFYLGGFLTLVLIVYLYLHFKKRPALIWHKVKLLVLTAVLLKAVFIVGGSLLLTYWLVPVPGISQTTPQADETEFSTTQKIEIIFDRPVDRSELIKTITPEVPGFWLFEDSLYTTHLYRKLVFIPTQSLSSDTKYQIKLSNIQSVIGITDPGEYAYSFKTQPSPKVSAVSPVSGTTGVDINSPVLVSLTYPNNRISEFDFELSPPQELEIKLDSLKKTYLLTPKAPLKQGTKYQLTVKKTDLVFNLPDNTVIKQGPTTSEYDGEFTTKEAPGLSEFSPSGINVALSSPLLLSFSSEMDRDSVEDNFSIEPKVEGAFDWLDDKTLEFKPSKLNYDTEYKVTVKAGTKGKTSGFLETDIVQTFSTIGRVRVATFYPHDGWSAAAVDSTVKVTFNQPVDKTSAEGKFSLTTKVDGSL